MRSPFVDAVNGGAPHVAKTADKSQGDAVVDSGWMSNSDDLNFFNGSPKADSENYLL